MSGEARACGKARGGEGAAHRPEKVALFAGDDELDVVSRAHAAHHVGQQLDALARVERSDR